MEWRMVCADAVERGDAWELRTESTYPQLLGEGRGVRRFNRFYRRLSEAWMARYGDSPEAQLAPGRY
ncbi:MAG: hypothetical protein IKL84_03780, partial [Clostridia bacterium]|nr:hypothetical protein [Clostridia bacterium]